MRRYIILFSLSVFLIIGMSMASLAASPELSEQVVYEQDGVKITLKSLEPDSEVGEIKLLIENDTSDKLIVQARNFCVNGYVIDTTMSEEVSPGKKANGSLKFRTRDFSDRYGIEEISDIKFQFIIYVNGFTDSYYTDEIDVALNGNENYVQKYDNSGASVYEDDTVEVVSKGLNDDGDSIILFVHNKTDELIIFQARDTSVDDYMVDVIMSPEIPAGAYAIDEMKFSPKDMEENELSEIKNVESGFIVYSKDFSVIEKIEGPLAVGIE